MREISSCFGEYAVQLSNTSCSSYANNHCVSPSSIPSIQNDVTCLYRTVLSSQKQVLITVSWCGNSMFQGLGMTFNHDSSNPFKLNTNSRLFRKLKGSKTMDFPDFKVEVLWDLTAAQYRTGPEPVNGYYVLIMVDSEPSLFLGDKANEAAAKRVKNSTKNTKSTLISRQERLSGNTLYSTKAQFCNTGISHDIVIQCCGEDEGVKHPVLSICIDKKIAIRVKRLQWNFRGNQSIFLDGLVVDLMWDVHDWFHNPVHGNAVFMFRTRNDVDTRLWLQQKNEEEEDEDKFSLLIYACKNKDRELFVP